MKVILNQDVKHLGEEGDVKDVANGYARNYLFPRGFAVPCNTATMAVFESRKAEIDAKKAAKRADAASQKEKLEATVLTFVMPAGANGKLYGAVTNQTIADEFKKLGFEIETFKSVGKYHVNVRLYETSSASVAVVVEAQAENKDHGAPKTDRAPKKRYDNQPNDAVSSAAVHADAAPAAEAE